MSQAPIQGRPYHHVLQGLFSFFSFFIFYFYVFDLSSTHSRTALSPHTTRSFFILLLLRSVSIFLYSSMVSGFTEKVLCRLLFVFAGACFFFFAGAEDMETSNSGPKAHFFLCFFACFVCRWGRRGTPSSGPRAPRTKSAVPSARVSTCRSSPKSSPSLGTRPLRLRFLVSPHFSFFSLFFFGALGTEILAIFGHSTVETEISGQGSASMCSLVFFLFFCWYFFFIS